MNSPHPSGAPRPSDLGAALAAEAHATQPAFDAALHERLMNALPGAAQSPRPLPWASNRFSILRFAAMVALILGSGLLLAVLQGRNEPDKLAALKPAASPSHVAENRTARSMKALLTLTRNNPLKMLNQLAAPRTVPPVKSAQPPNPTAPGATTPDNRPSGTEFSVADAMTIRLLSRSPFVGMTVGKPSPQTPASTP